MAFSNTDFHVNLIKNYPLIFLLDNENFLKLPTDHSPSQKHTHTQSTLQLQESPTCIDKKANKLFLHDYGDALSKSILFFEGQRSGKLPSTQRLTWRKDSALGDGFDKGVDLTGGYYDAGDNIKFNFPMAFSTTMLAWGVLEYGKTMGPELPNALAAVRWSTDYFLKATATHGVVFAQVGDPIGDHNCWQRPEDMDTPRTVYAVTENAPGSEVAAEMAAALAAASLVFKAFGDRMYSKVLLQRASKVFEFADKFRGSYNDSIGPGACPFYCDISGYQIEGSMSEFGWDSKHAGINVLVSKVNYILGDNPLSMSYMVGYGKKFPQRVHHRASSLPSIDEHPQHIECKGGTPYFLSGNPNPNLLMGAVVGGPDIDDSYKDDRVDATTSEPTTYINAPLVGLLAYFKAHSSR
ncbi:hypothetical protein DH2020_048504 [Rehmannia glutinosa]|uniref:Endoglucanase n=1 Tax=Rehmannia glutinosa TaxID=99300 RepID=A0ABR0U5G6_REHGL